MKNQTGRFWFCSVLFSALTVLLVPAEEVFIAPADAAAHLGQHVVVRGEVSQVRTIDSGMMFLNFGGRHPNSLFTAVVRPPQAPDFAALGELEGKTIDVIGTITEFSGRPQIELTNTEQIRTDVSSGEPAATSPDPSSEQSVAPVEPSASEPASGKFPAASTGRSTTLEVPLTPEEQASADKSPAGIMPTHAEVGWMPAPGLADGGEKKLFIVFSTDDGGGAHVRALPRFGGPANELGWSALAANGPVLEEKLKQPWHFTMIQAALRALEEEYPDLKKWPIAVGGNSGGAKRASLMAAYLSKEGYNMHGLFMGGSNDEFLIAAMDDLRAPLSTRQIHVFFSNGNEDTIAPADRVTGLVQRLKGKGFRNVRNEIFEGGHLLNEDSLKDAITWFNETL